MGQNGKRSPAFRACPLPHGRWEAIPQMTDEFDGAALDTSKWHPRNPGWKGRKPAFFNPANVTVRDGQLHLTARAEDLAGLPKGYHTFTTAAVKSTGKIRYGYFEIKARAMNSKASSAFWFYCSTPEIWTEIDVFEIGARRYPHRYYMNVHVFYTLVETDHWSDSRIWNAPYNLSEEFHLYGVEWAPDQITYYVDREPVRRRENTHWHQPLTLNFDSETFPRWFGLPDKESLPATFSIDYVRAWRRLDGPPADRAQACEFHFPGRKEVGNREQSYRLAARAPGTLVVKTRGGAERPRRVLLAYDDDAFFTAQAEQRARKDVTLTDRGGKTLTFRITWSKKPNGKPGRRRSGLQATAPHGYHPVQIEVLSAERVPRRRDEDYHFTAEDGTPIRVTVRH